MDTPAQNSPKSAIMAWGASLATKEYDGDAKKVAIASDAFGHLHDFTHKMPIGWNSTDSREKLHAKYYNYAEANINTKPYGFVLAIPLLSSIFWAIICGIISWAVQRYLDWKYPKHT